MGAAYGLGSSANKHYHYPILAYKLQPRRVQRLFVYLRAMPNGSYAARKPTHKSECPFLFPPMRPQALCGADCSTSMPPRNWSELLLTRGIRQKPAARLRKANSSSCRHRSTGSPLLAAPAGSLRECRRAELARMTLWAPRSRHWSHLLG